MDEESTIWHGMQWQPIGIKLHMYTCTHVHMYASAMVPAMTLRTYWVATGMHGEPVSGFIQNVKATTTYNTTKHMCSELL